MIDRKKAKLTDREIQNVLSSVFADCDDLEDCLTYFDENDEVEAAAKKEMTVMLNSMRLRTVALLCTKNIDVSKAICSSKSMLEIGKEDVKHLLEEIKERPEHWGPLNVRETAIKLCKQWLSQNKEA